MHTVSLFPSFLDYQLLGVFIVRVTLGFIIINFAYKNIFSERLERTEIFEKLKIRPAKVFFWIVTAAEFIGGVGLLVGFYTQLVGIVVGFFMVFVALIKHHHPNVLPKNTVEFYVILAVVSFSFLFLGPGVFAIDLPM